MDPEAPLHLMRVERTHRYCFDPHNKLDNVVVDC